MTSKLSSLLTTKVIEISSDEFSRFACFLEERCGILLSPQKKYLVQSRLNKIMSEGGFASFGMLLDQLELAPEKTRIQERVLDAMTTNETLWFRDTFPFNILKDRIFQEHLVRQGERPLRIWSAACSTGQEPYSISMCADEFRSGKQKRFVAKILATDICTEVLQQAKEGAYDGLSIGRGLSHARLERYFESHDQQTWCLKPVIKSPVDYRQLNLLGDYTALGTLDVIFCRNVLIYFSTERKHEILTKMHKVLKPGGILMLGASESLSGLNHLFQMEHCNPGILYRAI